MLSTATPAFQHINTLGFHFLKRTLPEIHKSLENSVVRPSLRNWTHFLNNHPDCHSDHVVLALSLYPTRDFPRLTNGVVGRLSFNNM